MTEKTKQIIQWKHKFLEYHKNTADPEILEIVNCIKERDRFFMMNCQLEYDYWSLDFSCNWDPNHKMFYFLESGKRIYFSPDFNQSQALQLYRCLKQEQDYYSPHRYLDMDDIAFIKAAKQEEKRVIVFELGAMEGMFSLHLADMADEIHLFECEPSWIKALRATFRPWEGKVKTTNRYVSNFTDETHIHLDRYCMDNGLLRISEEEKLPYSYRNKEGYENPYPSLRRTGHNALSDTLLIVKMDIEGSERFAVEGMTQLLEHAGQFLLFICTYHRQDDEKLFREIFHNCDIRTNRGYFCFYEADDYAEPYVRRCLLKIRNKGE